MVTRNECLMFLRKSVRKNVDITDFQPMEEDDPEEAIRMEELLDDVVNLLDELKEDQRNCMRLFYFEKLSYQQISVQLKMEIKAVKSAIQNGKRNIRIRLIEKNETNG
jgi:RNA polymerase sigma-70 factor (ECF subfamily)